jgi:prepilin-type N-terminal cleavage/methylation domain-containing protein
MSRFYHHTLHRHALKKAKKVFKGFTLMELLIAIALIGIFAGVGVSAINIPKNRADALDIVRNKYARQIENAIVQQLIAIGQIPNANQIPNTANDAIDICRYLQCPVVGCWCADTLIPEYIAALPVDHAETKPNATGYKIHMNNGFVKVTPAHLGAERGGTSSAAASSIAGEMAGSGTSEDPYLIASCQHLQDMNDNLSAQYLLSADIDCQGFGFTPLGTFTGTFDGQDHEISNLAIESTSAYVGFFSTIGAGGVARHVHFENASITGEGAVGVLAGSNEGVVDDVSASGNIQGGGSGVGGLIGIQNAPGSTQNASSSVMLVASSAADVGGLIGAAGGTIENSYATGTVEGGAFWTGGLIGRTMAATVRNSYATGNVSGGSDVGGLIGSPVISTISNSYATGIVTGTSNVGGLIGRNNTSSFVNAYWFNQPGDSASNCIGFPSAACTDAPAVANFYDPSYGVYTGATSWDFVTIWLGNNPTGYPTLR